MNTLTIKTEDQQILDAIRTLLNGFEGKFEIEEDDDSPYNPEFVKKIEQSRREVAEGKTIKYEPGTSVWEILNAQ